MTAPGTTAWSCLLLLGVTGAALAEPIELRLDLQEGQTYRLEMTTEQEIRQEVFGVEQRMEQTIGLGLAFEVERIDGEGHYLARLEYEWARFLQASPAGRVDYDSRRDENLQGRLPTEARAYAAMVGQSVGVTMTPTGEVREVRGAERMLDRLVDALGAEAGPEGRMMEQTLRAQFSDESISESLRMLTHVFPEHALEVGDIWSQQFDVNLGFPISMENIYRLVRVEEEEVTIEVESKLEPGGDGGAMDLGPVQITFALSGTQTGTTRLDRRTGWTILSEAEQNLSGEMKVEGQELPPGGMTIPMTLHAELRIERPE